jgi:hypothetical protein
MLAAFRFTGEVLEPAWSRPLGTASHMIRYPDTGELVVNDHDDTGDAVVVLDIETGVERARASTGSPLQSVVFPAAGFGRDFWYCSFARVAHATLA